MLFLVLQSGLKEVLREPDSDLQCRIYYLECLAHASYMVLHDGKAVLVDPRRDVEAYVKVSGATYDADTLSI